MLETGSAKNTVALSVEKIIDLIRTVRNDLVKDFLNDELLGSYYTQQFDKPLSNIKREFLRRDLKELLISPVDLVHYAKLITHIKETGTFSLTEKHSDFFYHDINRIMIKYSV